MFWITTFTVIVILISFNALYVLAEFSTVSARKSRLSQLAKQGNRTAETILKIVESPTKIDSYVATCQVGITISSLVLGFYGQAQLTETVSTVLANFDIFSLATAQSISATLILIVLSLFQIMFGELIPKNIGIQFPERMSTLSALPMRWSEIIFKPLIWLFNGSGNFLRRLFGLDLSAEHTHIHSPEEIAYLIDESGKGGAIKSEEHRLLTNTLKMRQATVRQVMIPRARMLAASISNGKGHLLSLVAESPYSRVPVYDEDIDNIIGVIHLRDLLCIEEKNQSLQEIVHSILYLPESMLVKEAFSLLQREKHQVAIVLDEYGGTYGMVTLEDILEQLFGDIQDEFDSETSHFQILPNNQIWIDGDMLVQHVNDLLEIKLTEKNIDTIGGLVLNEIGFVPIAKDEVIIEDIRFRVEKMRGRGVATISYQAEPDLAEKIRDRFS